MLVLKVGKLTIQGKGINLTQESTQEELKRALEHEPKLSEYIVSEKTAKNDTKKESN